LIGGAGVVRHLQNPRKQLFRRRRKSFRRSVWRGWNGLDERVGIERVYLVEDHNRRYEAIAHLRGSKGAAHSNHDVNISRTRVGTDRTDEEVEIRWISGPQDVDFDASNHQYIAELPREIAIRPVGQYALQGSAIGKPGDIRASGNLGELLLRSESW